MKKKAGARRVFILFLALMLVFTVLPIKAYADGPEESIIILRREGAMLFTRLSYREIPYAKQDGSVSCRRLKVYRPFIQNAPTPLIYNAHYEIVETDERLYDYLERGWTVVSPCEVLAEEAASLAGDDLLFNMAALRYAAALDGVDATRVGVTGSSAGGYTALMLGAFCPGIKAIVADSPITNLYFSLGVYLKSTAAANSAAMSEELKQLISDPELIYDPAVNAFVISQLALLPMPVAAEVAFSYLPAADSLAGSDMALYEFLSPIGHAEEISCPLVINHHTSDALVPLDQVIRTGLYPGEDALMPDGVSVRLDTKAEGRLGKSFYELLDPAEVRVNHIPLTEAYDGMPYDGAFRININVYDDGPVDPHAGHNSSGSRTDKADAAFFEKIL